MVSSSSMRLVRGGFVLRARRWRCCRRRRRGGLGAGRDAAVLLGRCGFPALLRRRPGGAGVCAGEQGGDGLGEFFLGGLGQLVADVVPGQVAEGDRSPVQVLPGRLDPFTVAAVIAYPDAGDVVGVAVDLPESAFSGDSRVAASHRPEFGGVVGAVVDPDAVGVDGPPGRGQEFDVVLAAERDRDIAAGLDQGGVLLIGGKQAPRMVGITQALVRAVLPLRDDPLVQQVLEFRQ